MTDRATGEPVPDEVQAGTADRPSEPGQQTNPTLRSLLEWLAVIVGALVIAVVIKTFLFQAYVIPSESMSPTLDVHDRVLVNKLSYDAHEVNRGDVVVFTRPASAPENDIQDLIKRVIALEGETIEARDGLVYIDGVLLEEPYLSEGTPTNNLEPTTVPEGHVFVMGDNRDSSLDGRVFGPIDESLIIGRAFVVMWPLSDLDLL